jgi:hypothetical protein
VHIGLLDWRVPSAADAHQLHERLRDETGAMQRRLARGDRRHGSSRPRPVRKVVAASRAHASTNTPRLQPGAANPMCGHLPSCCSMTRVGRASPAPPRKARGTWRKLEL